MWKPSQISECQISGTDNERFNETILSNIYCSNRFQWSTYGEGFLKDVYQQMNLILVVCAWNRYNKNAYWLVFLLFTKQDVHASYFEWSDLNFIFPRASKNPKPQNHSTIFHVCWKTACIIRRYFNGTEPTNLTFDYESDSLIILSFRTGRLIGNMSLGATYVGVSTLWDGKRE